MIEHRWKLLGYFYILHKGLPELQTKFHYLLHTTILQTGKATKALKRVHDDGVGIREIRKSCRPVTK